ncbi:hypothetical protein EIN_060680 [Entamoeba invadens IP1]|uniref:hypothetical protein n=1 Tax=Entamoeba invadens IP1 TaxID=370355 RepID=UPI0002C3D1F2|nr:hypothetical protein EIN_060680 [Entamoeba invadens IP1]ELP93523.1 hypothetical protein EIN_060680 [Entamoeba invadens IP1]|eukprot:XP_004260294.1 hypothetical protein EIN_060680 [Entamoeba invadens IP1]
MANEKQPYRTALTEDEYAQTDLPKIISYINSLHAVERVDIISFDLPEKVADNFFLTKESLKVVCTFTQLLESQIISRFPTIHILSQSKWYDTVVIQIIDQTIYIFCEMTEYQCLGIQGKYQEAFGDYCIKLTLEEAKKYKENFRVLQERPFLVWTDNTSAFKEYAQSLIPPLNVISKENLRTAALYPSCPLSFSADNLIEQIGAICVEATAMTLTGNELKGLERIGRGYGESVKHYTYQGTLVYNFTENYAKDDTAYVFYCVGACPFVIKDQFHTFKDQGNDYIVTVVFHDSQIKLSVEHTWRDIIKLI